ncbi:GATA zinc finger domain-containing protein 14 isoform X2 [Monomorium pharaonis]|nr:GATA zinc finger domain-containing protein 14 isoform X2 [Monomorium pharaonis]XP_028049281.1 GATA zinc finger domain-containing protein 14 isoform X2 [Monomorium pharaonis]
MDYAVESLEKTSDIERNATLNKLLNMQWLKNTSHSANPEKIKSVVYKQVQDQDVNREIEDQASKLTETIKKHLAKERDKYSSIHNPCEENLSNDTMPEKENVQNKDVITTDLFPNIDKLTRQKNEKEMLSIVENIVTSKLKVEFSINKENKDQLSTSENNAEDVIQRDMVCTNLSDLQKTNGGEELKLLKYSDGNNNESKSVSDKQELTSKITDTENNKTSAEAKNKDMNIKTNVTKINIDAGDTNLIKDNEKSSTPSNNSKKTACNLSKSLNTADKNGKDHFNNKPNTKNNTRKQEFVKQRNVSKSGIEKETKNITAKPNLVKTGCEAIDTYQNKNSNKSSQKQTSKQSKLKGQESLKKNASTPNSSDDKTERATPENLSLPLNESEKKNDKFIYEKNGQCDQKTNRVDFRKNTFVTQYKNSTFLKPTHISKTGQASTFGKNSPYTYSNPKFDRDRNGGFERKVVKKEHKLANTFAKSNVETEELNTNNLESCTKQKNEIIQPENVKSTCKVDAFSNRNDVNSVKMETQLIQSKENINLSIDYPEKSTTSEQLCEETNNFSKVDTKKNHQHEKTNNEKIDPFEHSPNLVSDSYVTDSQTTRHSNQYLLKLENVQHTNDLNQLESDQAWNQSSDNAVQKDATVMSLQQSIQNMYFNSQHTFTQAGNPTRYISPWESNNSKFYDQYFPVDDAMRMPYISNTFNTPSYDYNTQMSNDNVTVTSTLETTMSNRENSNLLYRYGLNVQHRPVMASDFSSHSVPSCQTDQARWDSTVQDSFHVEHPYVVTQPTMMHVYNPTTFGPDNFDNTHTIDYVSHPVIYAPSPYMQTWNSHLQYPLPVMYNSAYANYTTFSHNNQSNNYNSSMHDQQHKHNPYTQTSNYVRDTYDTNTHTAQGRNTVDNIQSRSNYYKKHQDNCRAVYDVPQYVAPVSYSRSQQGMNLMQSTTGTGLYNVSYCPSNQKHKQNGANHVRNQTQDFVCDDNSSEDIPPIISPKEFVTNDINISNNKMDQFSTRVFKPEYKTRLNSGYRPSASLPRYNNSFRRNTTFQDFPKDCTYPVSIGRGTYKTKRT